MEQMTNEQVIIRRAEVRKQISEVDAEKNNRMRAEKNRHYEELRGCYDNHAKLVQMIEDDAREKRLALKEELDRLEQMMRSVCPIEGAGLSAENGGQDMGNA